MMQINNHASICILNYVDIIWNRDCVANTAMLFKLVSLLMKYTNVVTIDWLKWTAI